ncbi:MAG: hypothetical protein ACE5GC_05035 [Acidimicrobiia bacterium]
MTFPLAVDRRAKRRRKVLLLTLAAVVVALVVLAVRHRTEERQTTDLLALAEGIADQEMAMATDLASLLAAIGELERPDIMVRLNTLTEESDTVRRRLEAEAIVPRPAAEVGGLFSIAVDSWGDALGGLSPAFVAVLDGEVGDETGELMLAAAFQDLRVGDAAYERFLTAVGELDPDLVTRDFPAFGFSTGDSAPLIDAAVIANRLRLIRKLIERHDVAVVANTDPEPVMDSNGVFVLPVAEAYAVLAVVTNEGNVGEESIEVSLLIRSQTGEVESIEVTQLIPFLEPGEARTIPFEAIPLAPGLLYELQLSVSIAEDADIVDNTFALPFFTNEAE